MEILDSNLYGFAVMWHLTINRTIGFQSNPSRRKIVRLWYKFRDSCISFICSYDHWRKCCRMQTMIGLEKGIEDNIIYSETISKSLRDSLSGKDFFSNFHTSRGNVKTVGWRVPATASTAVAVVGKNIAMSLTKRRIRVHYILRGILTVAAPRPILCSCMDWAECQRLVRGLNFSTVASRWTPSEPPTT